MNRKFVLLSILAAALANAQLPAAAANGAPPAAGHAITLELTDGSQEALAGGQPQLLEQPARLVDGSFFVPLRWVSERLGMTPVWNEASGTIGLTTPKAYIEWEPKPSKVAVNGVPADWEATSVLVEGTLLVKLAWIAEALGVSYTYETNPSRVWLQGTSRTGSLYSESAYPQDRQPNARPVAIFATDKASYRLGEPVRFIDLSYDADAEGLPETEWTGKRDAYFTAGEHEVTLRVRDSKGQLSDPYTRLVKVEPELFLSEADYPWHYATPGTVFADAGGVNARRADEAPALQTAIRQPEARKLIVGADGLRLEQTGVVYRDRLRGQARLYAYPRNGMADAALWGVALSNPSPDKPVQARITNEASLAPSLFSGAVAAQAAIDFLSGAKAERTVEVPPGATVWLASALLAPGQGAVQLADVETDGETIVSFAAVRPDESARKAADPVAAGKADAASGTFASADIAWEAAAGGDIVTGWRKWTFGATATEPKIPGVDALTGERRLDPAHRGTRYTLQLTEPRRSALALRVLDGVFSGALRLNGNLLTPPPGGLTKEDGFWLLQRLNGAEEALELEYMPAPGSTTNIELIVAPLDDLASQEGTSDR